MNRFFKQFALVFLLFSFYLHAAETLSTVNGISYQLIKPREMLPIETAEEARQMYYDSYDPSLNKGLSLHDLGLEGRGIKSYEEFREQLFLDDFASYRTHDENRFFFYAVHNNNIVGVCVVLKLEQEGHYYIDHIGVKKEHKGKGIGSSLMKHVENYLPDWTKLSLDTRVFNLEGQRLYEKMGYSKQEPHPTAQKQGLYFHYTKTHHPGTT